MNKLALIFTLIFSPLAGAIPDDFCPRLEGIDLQCTPVKPPNGGGGGGGESRPSCGPACEPGYNCPGDGGGLGGGSGSGSGDGSVPNPPRPIECNDQPTVCYYVRDGSQRTISLATSTSKVVSYTCRVTPGNGETPPTYDLIPTAQNCKTESPYVCHDDADRTTEPGTYNTCTGVMTCPAKTGFTRVSSSIPCPASSAVNLPLCSSLTTPPAPPCPPAGSP